MRAKTTLPLSPGRDATVLELRVGDMRRLLSFLAPQTLERPLQELAADHALILNVLSVASDCLELPVGESVEDLPLSEAEVLVAAWWGLHEGFFLRALGLLSDVASAPGQARQTSPAPASVSVSADSTAPGSGAGDTSARPSS